MRIETIGGRRFAFVLDWETTKARPRNRDLRRQRTQLAIKYKQGGSHYYYVRVNAKGQYALGGALYHERSHGAVFSFAATVAAFGQDGLYALGVDDANIWLCVVHAGCVVDGTDVIVDRTDALRRIGALRATMHFNTASVYADTAAAVPDTTPFDATQFVQHVKRPVRLQRYENRTAVNLAVAATIVACLIAAGIYIRIEMVAAAKAKAAAEKRAQTIAAYQNGVRRALVDYPSEPNWAVAAWLNLSTHTPGYIAGYALTKAECKAGLCDATYQRGHYVSDASATAPFKDAFGSHAKVAKGARTITVTSGTKTRPFAVTGALLHMPPRAAAVTDDWATLAPLHIYGVNGTVAIKHVNLAATLKGSAVGYPPFNVETVTLNGASAFPAALAGALTWAEKGHFRLTSFALGIDAGGSSIKWKMTFMAIYGYNAANAVTRNTTALRK